MNEINELKAIISEQNKQIDSLDRAISKLELKQLIHDKDSNDMKRNLWEIRRITNRTFLLLISFVVCMFLFWISKL